jgi:hypothetical protein
MRAAGRSIKVDSGTSVTSLNSRIFIFFAVIASEAKQFMPGRTAGWLRRCAPRDDGDGQRAEFRVRLYANAGLRLKLEYNFIDRK